MLQDYENLSSHSISEDEKRSQKAKKKSFSLDYEGKVSNMSDLQMLLKTADSLLQNNKIKEALKLYEHSLNQAENMMNKDDFKDFFTKTIKELNLISIKLMNNKKSQEGFEIISSGYQDNLQKMLQKADEALKSNNVKEALQTYDLAINQAFALYNKPDFDDFFNILIKELNIYSIKLLNTEKETFCYQILCRCDQWTQPGIYGSYPDLRVYIYNHFGCYYRRLQNLELALSFLMKALKLLNVSQNDHYLGLTHMNISAVLSHLGDHLSSKNHSLLSVKFINNEIKKFIKNKVRAEYIQKPEYSDLIVIMAISYHNLGNEEEYFNNFEKSYEYFQKSITELEQTVTESHPLLSKFKSELIAFLDKYGDKLKIRRNIQKSPKFLYEKEIQNQHFFKNRPKSANPNKKPQMNQSHISYLQANNLKPSDFFFIGNKIMRRPQIKEAKLQNNYMSSTNEISMAKKISAYKSLNERKSLKKEQDFALENSNLSVRSSNEINFLEKKGVLDWDSDASDHSEGEKIKKTRQNFLDELNKNIENTLKNEKKEEKTVKTDNNAEIMKKNEIQAKNEKIGEKPLKKEEFVAEAEKLTKLNEEKQQKTLEINELSRKGKNLEKKLEDLNKEISSKSTEIKSLESEENRKNKVLYDQDKEILKKIQDLQELEARQNQLKQKIEAVEREKSEKTMLIDEKPTNYSENERKKIVKIQHILKKTKNFYYVEKNKMNQVLLKAKGFLIPILEKNRYTNNLLKSQKKCDLLVYFEKPSRCLNYRILVLKPFINIFEHSFDMKGVFGVKKLKNEDIMKIFKVLVNEILGYLILLENKRLCLEEFILKGGGKPIAINATYELVYGDPIYSRVCIRESANKPKEPDPLELESQINENREKIEKLKKFEELARLEEEKRTLEREIQLKKEAKLQELKFLQEQKIQEEKEALNAKKELERKKVMRNKAIIIQRFIRKKLFLLKLEMGTKFHALLLKRTILYKGNNLLWMKIMKRRKKNQMISAIFYVFDKNHHISFRKSMKISENITQKILANQKYPLYYFSVSLLRKNVDLRDLNLMNNVIKRFIGIFSIIQRNLNTEAFKIGFEAISLRYQQIKTKELQEKTNEKAKKKHISEKSLIKKGMSIVKEESMNIDENLEEEINEEKFEEEEIVKEVKKEQPERRKSTYCKEVITEYLNNMEEKALNNFNHIKIHLNKLVSLIHKRQISKIFNFIRIYEKPKEYLEEYEENFEKSADFGKNIVNLEKTKKNEEKSLEKDVEMVEEEVLESLNGLNEDEELIHKMEIKDNLSKIHQISIFYQKKSHKIVIKSDITDVKPKEIDYEVVDVNKAKEFMKMHENNIMIIKEKQEKILFYSSSDLKKIKKIQLYQSSKKYKYTSKVVLTKSGIEFDLKFSSFQKKMINFSILSKYVQFAKLYEISFENVDISKNDYEKSVISHILSHIVVDPISKDVSYEFSGKVDKKKLRLIYKQSIYLINYEKEYEFGFYLDGGKKILSMVCFDLKTFKLEIPLKDDFNKENIENFCEGLVLELLVIFSNGNTIFVGNKRFSSNFYEVLAELKNVTLKENVTILSKIIQKDNNLYLINVNKRNKDVMQEAVYIGKSSNLAIIEQFKRKQCKKLLYEKEFFGIDEIDLVENAKDDNNFQVISQHNVIENRSQEDEDMNSAAIKIQTHYKKKKYNQKMKQKKSNNLDSSETLTKIDNSLRTIKEENETRNSHDILYGDTSFKEKDEINMPFDKEMDDAAKLIQEKYRKKKKNQKKLKKQENEENEQKTTKIEQKQKSNENLQKEKKTPIEDKVEMEFDEEMDKAALKIQKHYRNKKGNSPDKGTKEIDEKIIKKQEEKDEKDEILNMKFDEEMEEAAKKIQNKYRNRPKKKKNQKVEKKEEKEVINMEFDEEMEQAAKTIQKKYRKKQKNKEKIIKKTDTPNKIQDEKDEILNMKFDEEMEQAAKKIQNKYRNRPKKSPKKPESEDIQEKKPEFNQKQEEKDILDEVANMKFDEEMEQAAKKIQNKYRNRPKKQKKQEKSVEKLPKIENKEKSPKFTNNPPKQENLAETMPFDKEMDDAAKKIQVHYRNKKKPKHIKSEPKIMKNIENEKKTEKVEMVFDEEMDLAALKIQKKYRQKQANKIIKNHPMEDNNNLKQSNLLEKNDDSDHDDDKTIKTNKKTKNKENTKQQEIKPVVEDEEDKGFNMVIEEGMDDAARLIQQKYRKKKQNNKKIESIEKPKSFDELPKAKVEMEFDEEMESAAKKIQTHYRKKKNPSPPPQTKKKESPLPPIATAKKKTEKNKNKQENEKSDKIDESIQEGSDFDYVSFSEDVSQKDIEL